MENNTEYSYRAGLSAEGDLTVIVRLTLEEKKAVDKFINQLYNNNPIYETSYHGSVWIEDN